MRFEFADPGDVLRVVRHIPDARIQQLEGRNGIGKTMALRILQLCSNQNPWQDDPASLRSFCEHIPPDYRVDMFAADDQRFVFVLDPVAQEWSDELDHVQPRPVVLTDGHVTPVSDWTPLDTVVLSGRESLLDVLHTRVEAERHWFTAFSEVATERLKDVETAFATVGEWLADADAAGLEARQREIHRLATIAEELATEHERAKAAGESLERRRQRLDRAEKELPAIRTELGPIRDKLQRVDNEIAELQQTVDQAISGSGSRERQEAARARRLLEQRQRRYEVARQELQEALRNPLLNGIARTDLSTRLKEERQRLRQLEHKRTKLLDQEPLSALSRDLEVRLERHDNPEDVVADVHDAPVTVEALRTGVVAHQRHLPSIAQVERITEQIAETETLLAALKAADAAERNAQRKKKLKDESDEALSTPNEPLDTMLTRHRELMEERNEVEQSALDLQRQADDLLGGAPDLESLRASINAEGVSPDAASPEALKKTADAAYKSRKALDDARDELRHARERANSARHRLEEIGLLELLDSDADDLKRRLDQASDRLTGLLDHVRGCSDAYGVLADQLRAVAQPGPNSAGSGNWTPEARARLVRLNRRLSQKVGASLAERNISASLIDGAELGPIDLLEATYKVTFADGGRVVTRPLQTLSSGQMVYAYARAVIAGLEPPPEGRQRLIALDEFGAYLDDERRGQLLEALENHLSDTERTQILLVLPGNVDSQPGYDFTTVLT